MKRTSFRFYKTIVEGKEYLVSGQTVARVLSWPHGKTANNACMIECQPAEASRVLATPRRLPSKSDRALDRLMQDLQAQ